MGNTIIEKILASHSGKDTLKPGDIVDVVIDARVARDFGGANVVQHLRNNMLTVHEPEKTFFTFDCNPTGSDQKYASNQQYCRIFARENGIKVYDIDKGIGTHVLIEEGLAYPGSTAVSTDSHANILGAVGAFGQGMGDKDIAAAWSNGKIWFKVPPSVKIILEGERNPSLSAKDLVLNLLDIFGSNSLLGCAIELEGKTVEKMKLDERITMASMATELGAIIMLISPGREVIDFCESKTGKTIEAVYADEDAHYERIERVNLESFRKLVSLPGKPHDTSTIPDEKIWIDSAFIGSCTNGRIGDLEIAANILRGRQVARGVVLKIVPATNEVWEQALQKGYIEDFKKAGALISNAGCAGCAAGQVGQNGPGEVTISTGNRNFPGKQGQGEVYLAGPDVVAASAIAGYLTTAEHIPETAVQRPSIAAKQSTVTRENRDQVIKPTKVKGRAWVIPLDDIDTDMIFHNRHLAITNVEEMGQYAFGNLEGYEDFAHQVRKGDVIFAGKNFGSGSSRQQAVDCFKALGVAAIIAESFGAIYERNAINAAFPVLTFKDKGPGAFTNGEMVNIDFIHGLIEKESGGEVALLPFSDVQLEIYNNDGLF